MKFAKFNTSLCDMTLVGNEQGLSLIHLHTENSGPSFDIQSGWVRDDAFFTEAQNQINEYLAGKRRVFNLSLNPEGTAFQNRVWDELKRIPYGETVSYGDIAHRIGRDKAARAVGAANGQNPLALFVPCHRVVGKNSSLTGYAFGLEIKRKLLELEKKNGR